MLRYAPFVLLDLFLALLALLTLGVAVTFLMHALLRVPYVPTPRWVAEEMVRTANVQSGETVWDPGAGDAALLLAAKRLQPKAHVVGCELVPFVWLLGYVRCLRAGVPIDYRLGNALRQNLRDADVVLLYLTPPLLRKLVPKFRDELKPGTRIVSHAFSLPGVAGGQRREMHAGKKRAILHVYQWGASSAAPAA